MKAHESQKMIDFINKSLERTKVPGRPNTGLKLSKIGEQSVIERWNKSEVEQIAEKAIKEYILKQTNSLGNAKEFLKDIK